MQLRDDDLVDILKVDAGGQALLGAEQDAVPGLLQRLPQRPPLGEGGGGAGDLDQGPVRQELLDVVEDCGPLAVTTSFGENMELTAPGVNKGSAVQALCEKLGLEPDQVMAFGDAGNDLELLAWAGWSFAMGNASSEAKAAARYTTGTNREGGVGMAVEQYLLNA